MSQLVLLVLGLGVIVVVASIAAGVLKRFPQSGKTSGGDRALALGYRRQGRVMSENETAFYRALCKATNHAYLILAQLPLSRVISPERGERRSRQAAMNKIDRKTLDFVLINPETMAVVLAIEVNDSSHGQQQRQKRDEFVSQALAGAGVNFMAIPAMASYDVGRVGKLVMEAVM